MMLYQLRILWVSGICYSKTHLNKNQLENEPMKNASQLKNTICGGWGLKNNPYK
jgi:hypothetical protein